MTKKMESAVETTMLDIELADNGIILRSPEDPDSILLATYGKGTHNSDDYGYDIDKTNIYEKLGRTLYTWLFEVVLPEHDKEFVVTGFSVEYRAKCTGRRRNDE